MYIYVHQHNVKEKCNTIIFWNDKSHYTLNKIRIYFNEYTSKKVIKKNGISERCLHIRDACSI